MPIYEFYCPACHTVFNFFSASVNTEKKPICPKCMKIRLQRQASLFVTPRNRAESEDNSLAGLDESKMEQAINFLAQESEKIDENDPRQAADLMRKLTQMTGIELGPGMEEALSRMEAGENPEKIEAEMGDLLQEEEPFELKKRSGKNRRFGPPKVDNKLYDL